MSKGGKKGGLAFLETKSWAMNNPAMVYKIAEAERKTKAEAAKAQEVLKEREIEHQKELVRKQQIESGHINADDYVDRMDWMYDKPPGLENATDTHSNTHNDPNPKYNTQLTAQQREDFLLGKAVAPQNQHLTLKNVLETDKSAVWEKTHPHFTPQAKGLNQIEQATLLRNDPLLMVLMDDSDDDDEDRYARKKKDKKEKKRDKKEKREKKSSSRHERGDRSQYDGHDYYYHTRDRDRDYTHSDRHEKSYRSRDKGPHYSDHSSHHLSHESISLSSNYRHSDHSYLKDELPSTHTQSLIPSSNTSLIHTPQAILGVSMIPSEFQTLLNPLCKPVTWPE